MQTFWHFPIMIVASVFVFLLIVRVVIGKTMYRQRWKTIFGLAFICVVLGMLFGKYGANWGLPWWIYYPLPLLVNSFLPVWMLPLKGWKIVQYLVLSFTAAPFIHAAFSFFLGWNEYMPFWNIPSWKQI